MPLALNVCSVPSILKYMKVKQLRCSFSNQLLFCSCDGCFVSNKWTISSPFFYPFSCVIFFFACMSIMMNSNSAIHVYPDTDVRWLLFLLGDCMNKPGAG